MAKQLSSTTDETRLLSIGLGGGGGVGGSGCGGALKDVVCHSIFDIAVIK